MTIDEMIAVLEAAKAGKKIQMQSLNYPEERYWRDAKLNMSESLAWNFNACDYRVRPEPREWWANIYNLGNFTGYLYETKEEADRLQDVSETRSQCVKVREVLE